MKTRLLMLLCSLLFLAACKKDKDTAPPREDLIITIEEKYETPPSRVSVFFKVENRMGEPISGLTEADFEILEKGRNDSEPLLLSKDEATRVISDNAQIYKYHTMLLLDLSGSVLNNSLAELKQSANNFVDNVMANDNNSSGTIGIFWFDGRDKLHQLIDFTNDADALHAAINGVTDGLSSDSSTDLFGAILKGVSMAGDRLRTDRVNDIVSSVSIVVFTDGTDQAARYSKTEAYNAVDRAEDGINFYSIGLGSEIDETVLNRLGKDYAAFATDTDALNAKFDEIANLIFAEANSHYLFEYCTPKRNGSGTSELHIRIRRGNSMGQRVTEFDATGFTDDCDLF